MKQHNNLYIGILSGTSMDAVDAVLVDLPENEFCVLKTHREFFPLEVRRDLEVLSIAGDNEINLLGQVDRQVGELFAKTCLELLKKAHVCADSITAIGSHGQTIRHQPNFVYPFTLQIGDPNTIAEKTGITTIADFRRRDIVKGGQGAPLTPAFHDFVFRHAQNDRVVVNVGGIANLTFLPAKSPVISGFDAGPGNTLLDSWSRLHLREAFDAQGDWARSGHMNQQLLNRLLNDPYFQQPSPKSTGKEYFNIGWLNKHIQNQAISPEDVQATLTELTAITISQAVKSKFSSGELLVCGGGVFNDFLMARISHHAKEFKVFSTEAFGVDPHWVEAIAFAWLAKQTMNRLPGNIPSVTGASAAAILGGIYPGC